MLSRREVLGMLAASPLAFEAVALGAETRKPNVVVILSDDQAWGDLSVTGNKNLSTPNIDSLARDGAMFDRFFVCPVCSPTRAEFLTGRYHSRGGVRGVSEGLERLNLDERTIADTFKANGYAPDVTRFIAHCRWLIDNHVGLAIFGTNSESASLSVDIH